MPLDSQLTTVRCRSVLSGAAVGAGTPTYPVELNRDNTYTNGTGVGQCDVVYSTTLVITTGATSNIDLAGTATNAFGATLTMAKLKVLLIDSDPANTTQVTVSRPAANGVPLFGAASGATAPIDPGGRFYWESPANGVAVVAATGDLIAVTNAAGASAIVRVYAAGTSV